MQERTTDPAVPKRVERRAPAHSAESGAGVRKWPRAAVVGLVLLASPCLLVPVVGRWRARARLAAGDVCGPRSVLVGDPLDVAREALREGETGRERTAAAYALRVCRSPDAPLTPDEVELLRRAATRDPDANVRVAAADTLLSVAGGGVATEACLRRLEADGEPIDLTLHESSPRVSSLRDVCAHHHTGTCTVAHYVACVLLGRAGAPGASE